jgi:hypothetical protein
MSELLARRSRAERANHSITRISARALASFLGEGSQVLDHRRFLHHLRLLRRICDTRRCEMPNASASDTIVSPLA